MPSWRHDKQARVITVQTLKKKLLLNEQTNDWSAQTDVINVEQLDQQTLGDKELRSEIIDLFIIQARESFRIISSSQDMEAVRIAAHTLKGTARSIGAFGLATLASQVEQDQQTAPTMMEVELGLVVEKLKLLQNTENLSKHCNLYP